jgi:hypothetical protein
MDLDNDFLRVLEPITILTGVFKGIMVEAFGFHRFSALFNIVKIN